MRTTNVRLLIIAGMRALISAIPRGSHVSTSFQVTFRSLQELTFLKVPTRKIHLEMAVVVRILPSSVLQCS
jgi:hypothetical protein